MAVCPRIVIAGTRSGVGKTTVSVGIMRALTRQGLKVYRYTKPQSGQLVA
jgi:cobyrinic acid a,c-diamide synthase